MARENGFSRTEERNELLKQFFPFFLQAAFFCGVFSLSLSLSPSSLLPFPLVLLLPLLLLLRLNTTGAAPPHILLLAEQRAQRRRASRDVAVDANRRREPPPLLLLPHKPRPSVVVKPPAAVPASVPVPSESSHGKEGALRRAAAAKVDQGGVGLERAVVDLFFFFFFISECLRRSRHSKNDKARGSIDASSTLPSLLLFLSLPFSRLCPGMQAS